jgi:hypothetical protein
MVALAGFGMTLLVMGSYGTVPRLPILITSVVICAQTVGLVQLTARHGSLGLHIGYLMMLFGTCYWFALPATVFGVTSERHVGDRYEMSVSQHAIRGACMSISVYHCASVICYWISIGGLARRARRWKLAMAGGQFYLLLFGLFLLGFLPFMLYGGTWKEILQQLLQGRSATHSWKADGALGDQRSALYYLCVSGFVGAGGLAGTWAALQPACFMRKTLLGMYLIAGLVVFLDGGTRSWIALAWLPTILAWIAVTVRQNLTLTRVAACLLAIAMVQFIFETARAWRSVGWSLDRIFSTDLSKLHFDNDSFTDVAMSHEFVPRSHHYFGFGDVWAFVSHPIPRFLWKNKPVSPILMFYNDKVYHGFLGNRGNKLPSHIGQAHMSFGATGVVLLGALSGYLSALASVLMGSQATSRLHLGALVAVWWFLMARGIYPGWTYPIVFVIVVLFFGFRYFHTHGTNTKEPQSLAAVT